MITSLARWGVSESAALVVALAWSWRWGGAPELPRAAPATGAVEMSVP
jgi:hypothetical protein